MKWVALDLGNLPAVEAQVEEVMKTHEALADQIRKKKGNVAQIAKALEVLRGLILQRTHMMERFYQENDLDPRSSRIEACRIKLKRLLKGMDSSADGGGIIGSGSATSAGVLDGTADASPQSARGGADGKRGGSKKGGKDDGGTRQRSGSKKGDDSPRRGASNGADQGGISGMVGADGKITLKIQMTHAEYETLRLRREAMKGLKKGGGSLAWENPYMAHQARAGVDASAQGMSTFHDIPYQGDHFKQDALMRNSSFSGRSGMMDRDRPPFRTMMKPDAVPDPGFISSGPYTSANSEVVSRTLRYGSNQEAMTGIGAGGGGSAGLQKKSSFKTVVPRTRVTTTGHKMEPFGGGHF